MRCGAVPIIGFLAAGAVIGPGGVGLIGDVDLVNQSADIGVMLLLFTLGIEFSLERVRGLAGLVLGGGAIQVGITTGLVTTIVVAFGVEWRTAVFTGLLVSLSSTAIVLQSCCRHAERPHRRPGTLSSRCSSSRILQSWPWF